MAARYDAEGADELVLLDITASSDDRATMLHVVERAAEEVFIPLTVGGGVRSVADGRALLRAGADKVAVNSAAVAAPKLIDALASEFGAQCVVVAIDARRIGDGSHWEVFTHGGQASHGPRRGELGSGVRPARCRRDPAHFHGPGRDRGRLRPGADEPVSQARCACR